MATPVLATALALLHLAASAAPQPNGILVIALEDKPDTLSAADQLLRTRAKSGFTVLSSSEITARLRGTDNPDPPDDTAILAMLQKARLLEAEFHDDSAAALREQIHRLFEQAPQPSPTLRNTAGAAAFDQVMMLLAAGDRSAASEVAVKALRQFDDVPVDAMRLPPQTMGFLAERRRLLPNRSRVPVAIVSDRPGEIFVDGKSMGPTSGRVEIHLSPATYRIWLVHDHGLSMPYRFDVPAETDEKRSQQIAGNNPIELTIHSDQDERLSFGATLVLRCAEDCERDLRVLGKRAGVVKVLAMRSAGAKGAGEHRFSLLEIEVDSGAAATFELDSNANPLAPTEVARGAPDIAPDDPGNTVPAPQTPRKRFSPLYLLPLGGGQLAQERPLFAAAYALAEGGLLAWFVLAQQAYSAANEGGTLGQEETLREQRDLRLAVFLGTVALGVAEAVVVGLATGD